MRAAPLQRCELGKCRACDVPSANTATAAAGDRPGDCEANGRSVREGSTGEDQARREPNGSRGQGHRKPPASLWRAPMSAHPAVRLPASSP